MKRFLSLLTALLIAVTALSYISPPALAAEGTWACDANGNLADNGEHIYTVNEKGILTKYEGPGGTITIPDSITAIGRDVFYQNNTIKSVILPDSVTIIEQEAFKNSSLTSIKLPDGLTSIGSWAFESCKALSSITIPNGVTKISERAFMSCVSLKELTIPPSVTVIEKEAFWLCDSLTSITLSEGLKEIGFGLFKECQNLTSLTIPASVTILGHEAFRSCGKLTKLTFLGKWFTYSSINLFAGTATNLMTIYCYSGSTAEDLADRNTMGKIKVSYLTEGRHTVRFDTNGGTGIYDQYVIATWGENKTTKPEGVPIRSNSRFLYWCKDAALTTEWNFDTDTISSDITLYAKYEDALTYTVTFDHNNDSSTKSQIIAFPGEKITPPAAPYKPYCTFAYWCKDKECKEMWDFSKDTVNGNITLYAKYDAKYVSVEFRNDTGETLFTLQVQAGALVPKPDDPKLKGYIFLGWYSENGYPVDFSTYIPGYTFNYLFAKWKEDPNGTKPDDPSTPGETVIVPSDATGITINLTDETIDLGSFTVAAYSTNGGMKWIKGSLPTDAAKFSKMFDKEMTLWLSDTYNDRDIKEGGVLVEKKGVPDSANIVKFPKINARPKSNLEKLGAYYADSTWSLMTKPTKTVAAATPQLVYEYVKGNTTDGKSPDDSAWFVIPESGFSIKSKPPKEDKSKNVYYFRSAASISEDIYTPASKVFKISPAYYSAVLKYKIVYKTELLKLKKGDMYSVNSGTEWTEVTEPKGISLDVSNYITSSTNIMVKKAATGSKPRSEIQTIVPVSRAEIVDKTLTCAKGKITDTATLKKYEILTIDSKGNKKWGGLPKITENTLNDTKVSQCIEYDIRLKTDAKFSKDTWTGNAASAVGKLTITYGVYDESGKTPKSGIIEASISVGSSSN